MSSRLLGEQSEDNPHGVIGEEKSEYTETFPDSLYHFTELLIVFESTSKNAYIRMFENDDGYEWSWLGFEPDPTFIPGGHTGDPERILSEVTDAVLELLVKRDYDAYRIVRYKRLGFWGDQKACTIKDIAMKEERGGLDIEEGEDAGLGENPPLRNLIIFQEDLYKLASGLDESFRECCQKKLGDLMTGKSPAEEPDEDLQDFLREFFELGSFVMRQPIIGKVVAREIQELIEVFKRNNEKFKDFAVAALVNEMHESSVNFRPGKAEIDLVQIIRDAMARFTYDKMQSFTH